MSTLTITLSRDEIEGAATPLVLSGSNDANVLGIVNYQEPGRMARILWAPDSAHIHGSTALAAVQQQSILNFDVVTDKATTEATARTQIAELREALAQFSYTATVVVDGAPAEVWQCNTGNLTPSGARTLIDLERHFPVWAVSIPCHPIPTVGA